MSLSQSLRINTNAQMTKSLTQSSTSMMTVSTLSPRTPVDTPRLMVSETAKIEDDNCEAKLETKYDVVKMVKERGFILTEKITDTLMYYENYIY